MLHTRVENRSSHPDHPGHVLPGSTRSDRSDSDSALDNMC